MKHWEGNEGALSFAIHSPPWQVSAGVRALYVLRDELRKRGHSASIASLVSPHYAPFEDVIHVVPEIVRGGVWERCVRWKLANDSTVYANDIVVKWFSHHSQFSAPRLMVDIVEPELFYPKTKPGKGSLYFHYKGGWDGWDIPPDARVLSMSKPVSRAELAGLLRSVDVVYSSDPCSAFNLEATICGTPVVFTPKAADVARETQTIWGQCGYAFGYHADELEKARASVVHAAPYYEEVREMIASDVDNLVAMCRVRWS